MDTFSFSPFTESTAAGRDDAGRTTAPPGRPPLRWVAALATGVVLAVAAIGAVSAGPAPDTARASGVGPAPGPTTYSGASPFDRVRAAQAYVDRYSGDAARAAVTDVRYAAQAALAASATLAARHAARTHNV